MLRASIAAAASGTLVGRGAPAASAVVGAWPSAAVLAVTSLRSAAVRPSSSNGSCRCCCPCRASASASSASPSASLTMSSSARSQPLLRRVGPAATARRYTSAAAVSVAAAIASANVAVDPSSYRSLSLLVMLHECIKRAYGRPLFECGEGDALLALGAKLDSLHCCVLLLAPPSPPPAAVAATVSTSTSSSSGVKDGFDGGLRVQYLNRAAAEALKVLPEETATSSSSSSSSSGSKPAVPRSLEGPLLAGGDEDGAVAALLREAMRSSGPPRRGQQRCVTLRAADQHHHTANDQPPTITCPEALLVPLMSPNGACAGVALLFDRWEVRAQPQQPGDSPAGPVVVLEGRPLVPEIPPGSRPTSEAMEAMQQCVRGQADAVRALKTQQGLPNQDPRVVAAVAALQQLKAELELQQRLAAAFGGGEAEAGEAGGGGGGVVAELVAAGTGVGKREAM